LTGLCEPLGNARCKTARCRILGQAVACDERAEFEVDLAVARRTAPRCQNADGQPIKLSEIGFQGQQLVAIIDHQGEPTSTVVHPLGRHQARPDSLKSQPGRHPFQQRCVDGPRPDERRGSEGKPLDRAPQSHQADTTLLHVVAQFLVPGLLQPGMAGTQCWMACKVKLMQRREDAQAVVSQGIRGRQYEHRFAEIGPPRERQHLGIGQVVCIEDNSHGIPLERRAIEYIDDGVGMAQWVGCGISHQLGVSRFEGDVMNCPEARLS